MKKSLLNDFVFYFVSLILIVGLFFAGFFYKDKIVPTVSSVIFAVTSSTSPKFSYKLSSTVKATSSLVFAGKLELMVPINFSTTISPVTINRVEFLVKNAPTLSELKIGNVTQPVQVNSGASDGIVTFSNLNIVVPTNSYGTDVFVYAKFKDIAPGKNSLGISTGVQLKTVKYVYGSNTITVSNSGIVSPNMYFVASIPTVTSGSQASGILVNGKIKLMEVRIQADSGGPIKIKSIPINITLNGNVTLSKVKGINVETKDGYIKALNSSTSTILAQANSGNTKIVLPGGYLIKAGESITFGIYATVENVNGPYTNTITTKLGNVSDFVWDDINSNMNELTGKLLPSKYYLISPSIITNTFAPELKPTVQVLNPNGGETWIVTNNQNIKWKSEGGKDLTVYLEDDQGTKCKIGDYSSKTQSSIISLKNTNCGQDLVSGYYRLVIYNNPYNISSNYQVASDYSDNRFEIVGTSTIQILYPKVTQTLKNNSILKIRWIDTGNYLSNLNLSLRKYSTTTSTSVDIGKFVNVNNNGAYDWQLTNISSGQYILRISCESLTICNFVDSVPLNI